MARFCSLKRLVITVCICAVFILLRSQLGTELTTSNGKRAVIFANDYFGDTGKFEYGAHDTGGAMYSTPDMENTAPTCSEPQFSFMNLTKEDQVNYSRKSISELFRQPEKINCWTFPVIFQNETMCRTSRGEPILLIVLVMTAIGHSSDRDIIRKTWGSELKQYHDVRVTFVLGRPGNQANFKLDDMKKESEMHNDILLFDFIDNYDHLPVKTMMGMKWATEYCPNAIGVLKIDDDMMVNADKLLSRLKYYSVNDRIVGEDIGGRQVLRTGKWRLPPEQYPYDTFKIRYVQGRYYYIDMKTLVKLVEVSEYVPIVRIEDFYLTGLVRAIAGDTKITHDRRWYSSLDKQSNETYKSVVKGHYIAVHQAWMDKRLELYGDLTKHTIRKKIAMKNFAAKKAG